MTAATPPAACATGCATACATATVPTPFGPFTALVADDGAVLASGWTDDVALLAALVHPALRPATWSVAASLGPVTDAVLAFSDGDPGPAATVPVRQRGGDFVTVLWDRMREVPPGAPVSYGELAERAGRPLAARAAALACVRNAATLFVPCHRVRRTGGGPGGYRWGVTLKSDLQAYEAGLVGGTVGGAVHHPVP